MYVPTSRKAYKRHAYSGPRKSLKRVRGGLRQFYNEESRLKTWRSGETKKNPENEEFVIDNPVVAQTTQPRTYTRVKPKICLEATYSAPSTSTVTTEPVVESLEINSPQADPDTDSCQLTVETVPNKCLSGISGYRIVDLKHVIEWAFLLERHRNMCESSQIEFVSERLEGFRSELIFQCSMCGKAWKHCTDKKQRGQVQPLTSDKFAL